jgi:hypothetical protein
MHLSAEMWRMLPAFWVLGLLAIGFGLPLWLRRVKANPYYGVTIGDAGERDDIWYPVNALLGRDLVFLGVRLLAIMTWLATIDWRRPQHFLIVSGSLLIAEAMLFAARWSRLGKAVQRLQDDEKVQDPHGN